MTKEKSNGKAFKIALAVCTFVAAALLAWGSSIESKVNKNTGDIQALTVMIDMGFKHLEKVITEGRE